MKSLTTFGHDHMWSPMSASVIGCFFYIEQPGKELSLAARVHVEQVVGTGLHVCVGGSSRHCSL